MLTFFFLFLDYAVAESFELMNSLAKLCVTFWTEGVVSCGVRCTVFCLWMRDLRNMSRPFSAEFRREVSKNGGCSPFSCSLPVTISVYFLCSRIFFCSKFRTDLIYFVLCKRTGCELIVHFVVWQLPNLAQWARQFTMSVEAGVRFCGPLWCNISMRC